MSEDRLSAVGVGQGMVPCRGLSSSQAAHNQSPRKGGPEGTEATTLAASLQSDQERTGELMWGVGRGGAGPQCRDRVKESLTRCGKQRSVLPSACSLTSLWKINFCYEP